VGTLRDQFHIQDGALFNVDEIRAGMERVVKLYKDRGYPDEALDPSTSIDDSAHRVSVLIRISEGKSKS